MSAAPFCANCGHRRIHHFVLTFSRVRQDEARVPCARWVFKDGTACGCVEYVPGIAQASLDVPTGH